VINLPFPPSVNSIWRSLGRGRVVLSEKGRAYRAHVAACVIRERAAGSLPRTPYDQPVAVEIRATPPNKARRDIDNLPKAIFDALTHAGVWTDDSLVHRLSICWSPGTAGGVAIWITPISESKP
jgi:crossover junction endodeoxyribonuclease RusA